MRFNEVQCLTGLINQVLHLLDFYGDVVFAAKIFEDAYDNGEGKFISVMAILFLLCIVFLVLPWVHNVRTLIRFQKRWCDDPIIGERVRGWLIDWSIFLNCPTLVLVLRTRNTS